MDFSGPSKAPLYFLFLGGVAITFITINQFLPSDNVITDEVTEYSAAHDGEIKDIVKAGYSNTSSVKASIEDTIATEDSPTESIQKEPVKEQNIPDQYFEEIAANYQKSIVDKLPQGKSRTDIVVRYYKHPKDKNKINALKPLRFYIHERPIDSAMLPYESNAVFYGDSVSSTDLQLTVYNLVKAGFPIKKVSLSEYHDNWKAHAIEIGTDVSVMSNDVLSSLEISELK